MVMAIVKSEVSAQQRQQAIASAIGSVRAEGLEPSADTLRRLELYVEGKISTRSYQDKDGIQRRVTEITADTFQILGRKQEGQQSQEHEEKAKTEPPVAEEPIPDADDLPF